MIVKDRVVSWFIRNIVIPKMEIIDKPGFIVVKVSPEKKTYLRELFLPETLLSNIENKAKINGDEKILYSIGKNFGYVYSSLSFFSTIKSAGEKEFLDFAYFLVRYIEGTYAKRIGYNIDYKNKVFIMNMDKYVICPKSGLGCFLSSGGVAGIWSYMTCNKKVEGIQTKCQGRGDQECEVICAPYETLVKKGLKPFKVRDLEVLKLDRTYLQINKIRPTKFAKNSLRDLINTGFFEYRYGQVTYKEERHFLCEASFMFILEKKLTKVKNGEKTLWDVSFDFGKELAKKAGKQNPCKFIMDFLPALGWGDVLAIKKTEGYKVVINYFPWNIWAKDINFIMFRGMVSGLISGLSGKDIKLTKIKTQLSKDGFSLILKG